MAELPHSATATTTAATKTTTAIATTTQFPSLYLPLGLPAALQRPHEVHLDPSQTGLGLVDHLWRTDLAADGGHHRGGQEEGEVEAERHGQGLLEYRCEWRY